LKDALEAAQESDTIAILPPDGSDEEEIDEEADPALQDNPVELAGTFDIISDENQPELWANENIKWRRHVSLGEFAVGERVQPLSETHPLLASKNPIDLYSLFVTKEFMAKIAQETIRYARQSGDMSFEVTIDDIDSFIIFLLYSTYVHLPRQRMYWAKDDDISLQVPGNLLSRNKFMAIKKYLHFVNNDEIADSPSRFAKVQWLLDYTNEHLSQFGIFHEYLTIDERMISYTGRHPCKQYIKAKPVKLGYKMWMLAGDDGYPYKVDMYQGRQQSQRTTPVGYNVVMDMVQYLKQQCGDLTSYAIFFDNFFTIYRVSVFPLLFFSFLFKSFCLL
jgi:hypothetical protein